MIFCDYIYDKIFIQDTFEYIPKYKPEILEIYKFSEREMNTKYKINHETYQKNFQNILFYDETDIAKFTA